MLASSRCTTAALKACTTRLVDRARRGPDRRGGIARSARRHGDERADRLVENLLDIIGPLVVVARRAALDRLPARVLRLEDYR